MTTITNTETATEFTVQVIEHESSNKHVPQTYDVVLLYRSQQVDRLNGFKRSDVSKAVGMLFSGSFYSKK